MSKPYMLWVGGKEVVGTGEPYVAAYLKVTALKTKLKSFV